jgi:hypothetical protein
MAKQRSTANNTQQPNISKKSPTGLKINPEMITNAIGIQKTLLLKKKTISPVSIAVTHDVNNNSFQLENKAISTKNSRKVEVLQAKKRYDQTQKEEIR